MMNCLSKKRSWRWPLLIILTFVVIIFFVWRKHYPHILHKNAGDVIIVGNDASTNKKTATDGAAQIVKSTEADVQSAMTPQRAKMLMDRAGSITDIHAKARVYREAIRELCKAGYADEAWEMILDEPGFNRDSQITAFFLTAPLNIQTCVEKIAALHDSSEKQIALQYFLSKNFTEYTRLLEDPKLKEVLQEIIKADASALSNILGTVLRNRFDSGDEAEREKINQIVLDLHSKKQISNEDFTNMLSRNAAKPPAELWAWIANSTVGLNGAENFEVQMRNGIIERMVSENPLEAISKLATASGDGAGYDLRLGVITWAKSNPKAANEWYVAQRSSLPLAQQDSAAEAFATVALKFREVEGAAVWANQISNPDVRNALLDKINNQSPNTR